MPVSLLEQPNSEVQVSFDLPFNLQKFDIVVAVPGTSRTDDNRQQTK